MNKNSISENPIKYEKIGGWLILVGFGVSLALFKLLAGIFILVLFGLKADFTTPGTEYYHPLMVPILIYELAKNMIFFLFTSMVLFCFLRKKRLFPKLLITVLLANLIIHEIEFSIFSLMPSLISSLISSFEISEGLEMAPLGVIIYFLICLLLVRYLFVSKRVKGTFDN